MKYQWDFFIAHATPDKYLAETLYTFLSKSANIFLDSKCILLGDDWDQGIAEAQKESLITIVLVSSNTEKAYYQREEIAAAIDMARKDSKKHRVVPIILDEKVLTANIPYGLRLKHSIKLSDVYTLEKAANDLLELLAEIHSKPALDHDSSSGKDIVTELEDNNSTNLAVQINKIAHDTQKVFTRATIFPRDCNLAIKNLELMQIFLKQLFDLIEDGKIEFPNNTISAHGARLVVWHGIDAAANQIKNNITNYRAYCLDENEAARQVKTRIQNDLNELVKTVSTIT